MVVSCSMKQGEPLMVRILMQQTHYYSTIL